MKKLQNKLIEGTLLLTIAGFATRIIGFIYRIFLSDILGVKLLGIYQLVFPVYGICFTIYGAGIQTAISQLVASNIGSSAQKQKKDLMILKWGLFISAILSGILTCLVRFFAEPIASCLLLEPSCAPYLEILCFLFPFCGTSACINGYFYGRKEAKVPAVTQIIEQLVRVTSVVILCLSLSATGEAGCRFAVIGLICGEAASCFYNCFKLYQAFHIHLKNSPSFLPKKRKTAVSQQDKIVSQLLFLAFTLTTTKLVISILHSVESIFIPAALKKFGCSAQDALSIYGILSGIAMPFILFPSSITNSFSVMILPAIAQAQAEQAEHKIRSYITLSGKYSLFIGYLFTCIFLLFGKEFGILLFHSEDAGIYIYALSWLCPFLYLSTTFTSIINGLGKTQLTFFITVIGLSVKIYFLIFLVPLYGIQAYLAGSLISQITMTLFEVFYLRHYISFSAGSFLLLPCFCLLFLGGLLKKLYLILPVPKTGIFPLLLLSFFCLLICLGYLFVLGRAKCIDRKDFL